MESYMTLLKSYSGRDKVLRTLGYTAVFVSGAFKEGKIHKDLNTVAKQFSQTRTVLRLFDDIPMLFITKANLASKEKDLISKALNIFGNIAILIYFPFEKVAWLTDHEILPLDSSYWWWMGGISCWALCLVFSILRNFRRIAVLRRKQAQLIKARKLEVPETESTSDAEIRKTKSEEAVEFMTLVKNGCDLVMAVNWLPPGILWSTKIPPNRNALFGVISSLIGTAMLLKQEAMAKKKAA